LIDALNLAPDFLDDTPMEPYVAELIGVAAAAASLYSAHAKTMVPLRVAAIVGNILAIAYSLMLGTYPTFMLNAALLALHGWRLRAMLNLIRDIDVATGGDMNVDWLLPYTRPKHFKADDIMMERENTRRQRSISSPVRSRSSRSRRPSERAPCSARSVCSRQTAGAS
jgi:hypothetical protein